MKNRSQQSPNSRPCHAIAASVWWMRSDQARLPPAELESVILSDPRPLAPFTLMDHDGKPLTQEHLKGHWTLLFFGYTHCPDICPTTLAVLKGVAQKLDNDPALAASTRTLFVSVDPQRDTPEHLKQYITYFNPDFVAATGNRNEIDNLTMQVGAIYMFNGDTRRDDYNVDHRPGGGPIASARGPGSGAVAVSGGRSWARRFGRRREM